VLNYVLDYLRTREQATKEQVPARA